MRAAPANENKTRVQRQNSWATREPGGRRAVNTPRTAPKHAHTFGEKGLPLPHLFPRVRVVGNVHKLVHGGRVDLLILAENHHSEGHVRNQVTRRRGRGAGGGGGVVVTDSTTTFKKKPQQSCVPRHAAPHTHTLPPTRCTHAQHFRLPATTQPMHSTKHRGCHR
jgi:hypothetical protein